MSETELGDKCFIPVKHKKVGRPTKLTEEIIIKITDLIRAGNFIEVACACNGISKSTYNKWLLDGSRSDDPESLVAKFSAEVMKAEGECIADMNARMALHEKNSWKPLSWRMQTRFRKLYGSHDVIEVVGNPLEGLNDVISKSIKNLNKKDQVEDPTDEVDESEE